MGEPWDYKLVDSQGEPLSPDEARRCATCGELDHVDGGEPCDGCERWIHDECQEMCDGDEPHALCEKCAADTRCPVCEDIASERETRDYVREMRP